MMYWKLLSVWKYNLCVATPVCPPLTAPDNGDIDCSLEDDGIPIEGDTCYFTCDEGFELSGGNLIRECQSDGSWSGSPPTCDTGRMLLYVIYTR